MFDLLVDRPDAVLASSIVWFDALVSNVDRTARNPNQLMWHRRLWLIDHGAALYFHHTDGDFQGRSADPFTRIADHVLLPLAGDLAGVDAALAARLTPAVLHELAAAVPDDWLRDDAAGGAAVDASARRSAYVDYLCARIAARRAFIAEAQRARALHV